MATASRTAASGTAASRTARPSTRSAASDGKAPRGDSYVLPLIHTGVPSRVVDVGFWGALVGSVALGAVDPPLGLLLGAGVVVARHRARSSHS